MPDILDIVLLSSSTVGVKAIREKVRQSLIDSGATAIVEMKGLDDV